MMKKTRIAVIATSPKTRGGITSVIKSHQKGEFWRKYNIVWIPTHIDRSIIRKILVLILGILKFLFYLTTIELIHVHLTLVNSAKRKSIFINIAKRFNKKIIIHFHPPGHNPEHLKNGLREYYSHLFLKADRIIVLSNYWKTWLADELNINNKVEVVYNPCSKLHYTITEKQKEKIILFAGSLIQRKGYMDLINAFSTISTQHPDWRIVFAGNGEIDKAQELAKERKIINKIECTGWIKGPDLQQLFINASIFCLPSYGEGFPMAILDAWSYGLPVISTKVGGLCDVLNDGVNALTFNPGDIKTLADQLNKMISDKELRKSIAEESVRLAENDFNLVNINKKIGSIYDHLLNDGL
ncbi:glycosyltransferase family 4 protein [Saccharicrinis sp. FJH54]|uniref:glycosyltransferase family 4 protein n=1 Tax=Saccharicrinis sp. FJH54 TaxID=3344665 RepID=UPI0035D41F85